MSDGFVVGEKPRPRAGRSGRGLTLDRIAYVLERLSVRVERIDEQVAEIVRTNEERILQLIAASESSVDVQHHKAERTKVVGRLRVAEIALKSTKAKLANAKAALVRAKARRR